MSQVLLQLITFLAILWASPAACQTGTTLYIILLAFPLWLGLTQPTCDNSFLTVIGEFSPIPIFQDPTSMEITRVNFTCGPVRASVIALSGDVNINNSTIGGTLFAQGSLTASNSTLASQLACNSSSLSVVVLGWFMFLSHNHAFIPTNPKHYYKCYRQPRCSKLSSWVWQCACWGHCNLCSCLGKSWGHHKDWEYIPIVQHLSWRVNWLRSYPADLGNCTSGGLQNFQHSCSCNTKQQSDCFFFSFKGTSRRYPRTASSNNIGF